MGSYWDRQDADFWEEVDREELERVGIVSEYAQEKRLKLKREHHLDMIVKKLGPDALKLRMSPEHREKLRNNRKQKKDIDEDKFIRYWNCGMPIRMMAKALECSMTHINKLVKTMGLCQRNNWSKEKRVK